MTRKQAATHAPALRLRLFLVRHGQTACSVANVYCGRHCDPSLTQQGHAAAAHLRGALEQMHWDGLYTSPQRRAQQTLQPLADALGLTPRLVPDLAELDYGDWDAQSQKTLRLRTPDYFEAWRKAPSALAPPGGETASMLWRRTHRALMAIVQTHTQAQNTPLRVHQVLVVSHKCTLRVAFSGLFGLDINGFREHVAWPLGAVAQVNWTSSGPLLVRLPSSVEPIFAAP